ncbi:MAG: phosphodiester glycosidase family protein [Bacteroidota bacterium]
MPVRLAAVLFFSSSILSASAQVPTDWAPREDVNAELSESIRVFETTTPGASAWYVRADPADASWRLAAELSPMGTETVASFASRNEALVALNGGYFGGSQSFSLVLDRGQAVSSNIAALTRSGQTYYPTRGAFGLLTSGQPDVAWIYDVGGVQTAYDVPNANREGEAPEPQPTASFPAGAQPWSAQTAIGGGPVLVENGQVRLTWEDEVFFGGSGVDTTSARARTAAGYDADGHLLLFAARETPGLTLRQLAQVLVSLGAVEAVNLDGGGSTGLIAGGRDLLTSVRRVASALMIVPRENAEGRVYDTGDPVSGYREESAWFGSANTPFFGATPSRLLEVGTEGRAVFAPQDLPITSNEPMPYALDAWWVPASNRAADTPFVIYRAGVAVDTLRADQSDPASAGQWNYLGDADLAPGDSIAITGDATPGLGTTFVNVDAIRLTSVFGPSTEESPESRLRLRLAPNPARDRLAATLTLRQPGEVRAALVDALGRTVRERSVRLGAGEGRVEVDVRGLAPGVYTLRVTTPEGTASRRATVIR